VNRAPARHRLAERGGSAPQGAPIQVELFTTQ